MSSITYPLLKGEDVALKAPEPNELLSKQEEIAVQQANPSENSKNKKITIKPIFSSPSKKKAKQIAPHAEDKGSSRDPKEIYEI